jgi:hypothetical protein
MILNCSCKDEWMDKRYGKGRRVCNKTAKVNGSTYRCTVCKAEHNGPK